MNGFNIPVDIHTYQEMALDPIPAAKQPKLPKMYDGTQVAHTFIEYFYRVWCMEPDTFVVDEVIKQYSKFVYNNCTYEGMAFVEILKTFSMNGLVFDNFKFEILDSGSRQIYLLVTGTIGGVPFTQSFMIAYAGENKGSRKWTLMNSLLIL